MVIQILAGIGLVGYILALVLYGVEAWQQSIWQAAFCVFLPFYLLYFAFIKSEREILYRLVLAGSVFLFFLLPGSENSSSGCTGLCTKPLP